MIADLIGEDRITVIAASELVTEKKEERRKVWHPFVARAASVVLGIVILNMTPAPAEAAPIHAKSLTTLHIMSNTLRRLIKAMAARLASFYDARPKTA
ncbi:MAG: hypothetical protein Q8O23_04110, partial [Gallionella sp.]|nr:hypothetical protein [Gallionella sp.]